jgi:citrate synthase
MADNESFMEPWRTALATSDATNIWIRGYDIASLMRRATFVDTIFLLHQGRLPDKNERRLLDAILISVADHGAGAPSCATARLVASGNRQSLSAAIAAGILAIGDEHGGAGALCMEMIEAGVQRARAEGIPLKVAAERTVDETKAKKGRLPGMGHRVHTEDPRKDVLFNMARECGLAKDGIAFVELLEAAAREKIKPLPINVDGALAVRLRFSAGGREAFLHHRTRSWPYGGSSRRIYPGKSHAHSHSSRIRRGASAGASLGNPYGKNDYNGRKGTRVQRA